MACLYSTARLREHVYELAGAFKIKLLEVPAALLPIEGGSALVGERFGGVSIVMISHVTSEAAYCAALHEIGHCVHPTGSIRTKDNANSASLKLIEENSAWEWAQRHALDWTVEMESVKVHCMASYTQSRARQVARTAPPVRPQESMSDFLRRTRK